MRKTDVDFLRIYENAYWKIFIFYISTWDCQKISKRQNCKSFLLAIAPNQYFSIIFTCAGHDGRWDEVSRSQAPSLDARTHTHTHIKPDAPVN